MSFIFRGRPKKKPAPFILTDRKARQNLQKIVPCTWVGGIGHRWEFVRETRTKSGTLAYVYRDPFNNANERVWAVDFRDGTLRDLGPAHQPRPAPPPVRALPAYPRMETLPPPRIESRKAVARLLGEALIRRLLK